MELRITLPLDNGFLRRKCPKCNREFKWHDGPTAARPPDVTDPPFYHCPYCGEPSAHDGWWTESQIDYATQMAAGPAIEQIEDELGGMARRSSRGLVQLSVGRGSRPAPPAPLVEPADMIAVESPCHPWEPIKVAEDWEGALHCLYCGAAFRLE